MTPVLGFLEMAAVFVVGLLARMALFVAILAAITVPSQMPMGSSRFNAYEKFRLNGQGRLSIWVHSAGILGGLKGRFVIRQPVWTRGKFGNWLHKTSYGMHAAIDVFSSNSGDPEHVLAPLDAKIIGVFAKDAEPNSPSRIKAIYLKSEPIGTAVSLFSFGYCIYLRSLFQPGNT